MDIYDETTGVDEGNDDETDDIQRELENLRALREALEKRMGAYICKGTELKETLALAQASPSYYAALCFNHFRLILNETDLPGRPTNVDDTF